MTANLTLTYGSLNLTASPYLIEFGSDFGAPQNVYETLAFLLQDGEVALSPRASNRTLIFNVMIEGASLTALATAEAALILETEKPMNTITVDPGDSAPAGVYETYRGQVTLARDDNGEIALLRRYTVTVSASPFVRSNAETVAAALPASGSTTTLVDACSVTTGWTGAVNGSSTAPSVVSGAVGITTGALAGTVTIALTRTGSITTSATPYLMIDWKGYAGTTLRAYGDGTELVRLAQAVSPTAGYTRTWFTVAASSVAVLRLDAASTYAGRPGLDTVARSFYVDNVNRTDVKPSLGTARQLLRLVPVTGSARAQASLAVEHASSSLGDVFVYVFPETDSAGRALANYTPPLRPYWVSGNGAVTADSTLVSGGWEQLGGLAGATFTVEVPVRNLPVGSAVLMMRTKTSAPGAVPIQYTARVFQPSGTGIGPTLSGNATVSMTSSYDNYAIARLNLPPLDTDSATAVLQVRIGLAPGLYTAEIDEAWLFGDVGQLIYVAAGTGTPTTSGPWNRIFIEPARVAYPRPSLKLGFAADGSDAVYPPNGVRSWQQPVFQPSQARIFTVTSNALDASVTLRHFPRWHTNPGS